MFTHRYRVSFYDTDAMRVVHHANYVRIMEVARIAWMRELDLMKFHIPQGPDVWAVTSVNVQFLRSAIFDDDIEIQVEGRMKGAQFQLRYALWLDRLQAYAATGETELVPMVAEGLTLTRLPLEVRERLRQMPWSEQWPPVRP